MWEKSAIKKTKVHKPLKITTPDDSDDASGPKENPAQEKEILVEKDQITSAEGNDEGVQMPPTVKRMMALKPTLIIMVMR
jgi:hypothetical protein